MAIRPPQQAAPTIPILQSFLRQQGSGHNVLTQEMYDYFGGDKILEALKKYDPNASVMDTDLGGGEGGSQGKGKQFQFDLDKLPKNAYGNPGAFGVTETYKPGTPANTGSLYNPNEKKYDENYGWITPSKNAMKSPDPTWTKIAPLFVGGLAALGPAAAAAGLPAVAGGTSAVTGAAAGLAAGNIPGGAATSFLGSLAQRGGASIPRTGMDLANGRLNPTSLVGPAIGLGLGAMGLGNVTPWISRAQQAYQIYNMTRKR